MIPRWFFLVNPLKSALPGEKLRIRNPHVLKKSLSVKLSTLLLLNISARLFVLLFIIFALKSLKAYI